MVNPPEPPVTRVRSRVSGLVQGVGFRPFVWREAAARGLSGWVSNDPSGVLLEIEGAPDAVRVLLEELWRAPAPARVDRVDSEPVPPIGSATFEIRQSATTGARRALVPSDLATCTECLRELHDPTDRRFGHPFISCTACGPRYTIVQSVPYDRSRTTMDPLPLCAVCEGEYQDPGNRRFHAEPVCCPACGPSLQLLDRSGAAVAGDPVTAAAALLRHGAVLAVKGLGGYHLAVDAEDEVAVRRLRQAKHREDRPFAVMVPDLAAARRVCEVDRVEEALLTDVAAPIVLLQRRAGATVAAAVAPGSPTLGLMLPYTPVHALLLDSFGGPLVLTSGNRADEPIAYDDADAATRLRDLADAFLLHDRAIHTRVDDSVVKVVRDRVVPIRRSRGYVPNPIRLPLDAPDPVLACGAGLKNTFCITRGSDAFVSHHIGDLDDHATLRSYVDGIAHLEALLDVHPAVVAHDLHPELASTRYAVDRASAELVPVQHHHAHIASCLADNGVTEPVIGVAFDGIGLGTDGTVWGGEILLADLRGFSRAAHLATVPMPGGDAATRHPWRMAAAHLDAAFAGSVPAGLAVVERHGSTWEQVVAVARGTIHAPLTSSAGRLFDAVSALLGVREQITYEGQAAIELEHVADATERGSYVIPVDGSGVIDVGHLIRAVTEDVLAGVAPPIVAARFHNALADVVVEVCGRLRDEHGLSSVALSGGVFQNALLLARCVDGLGGAGFCVLTHRQVPPNDGGISLGQAAIACAQLHAR